MTVPSWAYYTFLASFLLIVLFLLLDYMVIRRNALGNTCCAISREQPRYQCASPTTTGGITTDVPLTYNHKRSTNMVFSV